MIKKSSFPQPKGCGKELLAFFVKLSAASTADNLNFTLSTGDTKRLPTVRAFKISVLFVSHNSTAETEPSDHRLKKCKKAGVFHVSLSLIGRKKAKKAVNQNQVSRNGERKKSCYTYGTS